MAKLIKILAASVGGGLVLGAGIRLGEAIAGWEPAEQPVPAEKLSERLNALESRLQLLETEPPESLRPHASESPAAQLDPDMASFADWARADLPRGEAVSAGSLRTELQMWLEESVTARMAEVESRLRAESERGQQQMLDAFVDSVQTRVIQRITQLEEEVAGQSASMNELRECSLRTERSVQKLLGGLDRLIVRQTAESPAVPASPPETSAAESAATQPATPSNSPSPPPLPEPPTFGVPPGSAENPPRGRSGWRIFR